MPDPQLVGDIIENDLPELSQPKPVPTYEETRAAVQAAAQRFAQVAAADATPAEAAPVALDNLSYLLRRRAELTLQINEWTTRRDDIDAAIKDEMGNHEVGTVNGRQIVHWTTVRSRVFDHKRFKAAAPEVYETYMTERVTRRFTLDAAAVLAPPAGAASTGAGS